jgi:hypothetical protein
MSVAKKRIRAAFRDAVFTRAKNMCQCCPEPVTLEDKALDAHHVTDRNEFINGGYVKENGIALCAACHIKAEMYHSTGQADIGFHPDDLYAIIESSYDMAKAADKKFRG